jgi:hypothetical protein
MRLVSRIDSNPLSRLPAGVALCVALALSALPALASAQALSGDAAPTVSAAQQGADPAPDETPNVAADAPAAADIARAADTSNAQFLGVPADGAAMNDVALDDQVLSRQRGGAAGMVMVAATPQLMHGSAVTLWDEIAPPSPLPIPIDAARAAQGNVANYQRK